MNTVYIILIVLGVLLITLIIIYNTLVKLRNNRESAFANIDVQLQLRHDLVPQLVSTVKGYAVHESTCLSNITVQRTAAMNAQTIDEKIVAENRLSSALNGLRVSLEAYPELKAAENFRQLQSELSDIENKLAASRRYFNSATKEYNCTIQCFPTVLVAGMLGFRRAEMFGIAPEDADNIKNVPTIGF